jgi:hypothetical protein
VTEIAYLTVEDYDAGVGLLYWDEAGLVNGIGYGDTLAWMTNVFTSQRDSTLTHVDFWTTDHNAAYAIIVYRDGDPSDSLENLASSQMGTCAKVAHVWRRSWADRPMMPIHSPRYRTRAVIALSDIPASVRRPPFRLAPCVRLSVCLPSGCSPRLSE